MANRKRYTSSGVPTTRVLPSNLWNPKYKLPFGKNFYVNRAFSYFFMKYNLLAFVIGGFLFTDNYIFNDEFNCRPDLNNFKAMVPISEKERNAMKMFQDSYFGMDLENSSTSWIKRLSRKLFPSVDYNPSYEPFFDYKKRGYFPDELSEYYSRS